MDAADSGLKVVRLPRETWSGEPSNAQRRTAGRGERLVPPQRAGHERGSRRRLVVVGRKGGRLGRRANRKRPRRARVHADGPLSSLLQKAARSSLFRPTTTTPLQQTRPLPRTQRRAGRASGLVPAVPGQPFSTSPFLQTEPVSLFAFRPSSFRLLPPSLQRVMRKTTAKWESLLNQLRTPYYYCSLIPPTHTPSAL